MVQGLEMGLLLTDFQMAVILVCGVISRDMGLLKIAVVCVQTIYCYFCGMRVCMCVGRREVEGGECT